MECHCQRALPKGFVHFLGHVPVHLQCLRVGVGLSKLARDVFRYRAYVSHPCKEGIFFFTSLNRHKKRERVAFSLMGASLPAQDPHGMGRGGNHQVILATWVTWTLTPASFLFIAQGRARCVVRNRGRQVGLER
jgi:hypothetical protein